MKRFQANSLEFLFVVNTYKLIKMSPVMAILILDEIERRKAAKLQAIKNHAAVNEKYKRKNLQHL